jgi:AraC-like DNA-binding protein
MHLRDSKLLNIEQFGVEAGCQAADALFFIVDGSFTLTIDGKTELITKNSLVCFPSDMYFERRVVSPLLFYYVKLMGGDPLPQGRIALDNPLRLLSTFHLLHGAAQNGAYELADHFLKDVFMQIEAEKICTKKSYDPITNDVIRYFQKHIKEKICLSSLTNAFGISATALIEHFKANLGMTPFRYLTVMRITRAEELLATSDLTLFEIAAECGYDTPFYLSNAFKKEKGIAPRAYRSLYRV